MMLDTLLLFDSRIVGYEGIRKLQTEANDPRGISIRNDECLLAHDE